MYQVEIIWNRSFIYVPYGKEHLELEKARKFAKEMLYSGDGARIKKAQVINLDTGDVVLQNHEL